MKKEGEVFLIGAGPGDPGLLTIRGKSLIEEADVIVYDALVEPSLLDFNASADKINVGKRGGDHIMPQSEINSLLTDLAKKGLKVVRLKGGDPFLFGRGAEEAEFLIKEGIKVHVVPGVSSAISVPELCGIPVTHRDHSSMVTFVTGHERGDREEDRLNWQKIARCGGTIVILMGMENALNISRSLCDGGLDPTTPVAVIMEGSTPRQRSISTNLRSVSDDIKKNGLKAPGIIVVGDCVSKMHILGDLR